MSAKGFGVMVRGQDGVEHLVQAGPAAGEVVLPQNGGELEARRRLVRGDQLRGKALGGRFLVPEQRLGPLDQLDRGNLISFLAHGGVLLVLNQHSHLQGGGDT